LERDFHRTGRDRIPIMVGASLFRSTEADRFDPQFEWCGHAYFSSGAFACKRNVIHFEKWMEAESWGKENSRLVC
jgi:hypothetical protein